ncbi:MAG: SemiSWEET family transporter [Candidatus Buchananbacteria bacterium]|nr:SemiSWEET family transporter [Candidatus Buchananbacteria bacterium]
MAILGLLATLSSLMIVFLGFPAQIIKNYRRKSCDGIAPTLIYSACCGYTLWSLYGWTKPDWFLAIAQTPGCILSFILLFQIFYYRKRQEKQNLIQLQ